MTHFLLSSFRGPNSRVKVEEDIKDECSICVVLGCDVYVMNGR